MHLYEQLLLIFTTTSKIEFLTLYFLYLIEVFFKNRYIFAVSDTILLIT